MKGVYRFTSPSFRGGDLSGIFVAHAEDVEKAKDKTVYFGEVLGKHPEVSISEIGKHIALVTDAAGAVDTFELFEFETGYNPLSYIEDAEQEED